MRGNGVTVRPMVRRDLDEVMAIQTDAYAADLRERGPVIEGRLLLFPHGCWIAERSETALGYLISHPWDDGSPPDRDRVLQHIPEAPACYYIHDLAIRSSARGLGAGRLLVESAFRSARESGLTCLRLVAAQGSEPFWRTFGFRAVAPPAPARAASLAGYGANACMMAGTLPEEHGGGTTSAGVVAARTGGTHHV